MANRLDKVGLQYFWDKIKAVLNTKQDILVSGTNIKTINSESILGSGDISIGGAGLQNLVDGSEVGSVRGINTATEDSSYTIGEDAFAEGYNTKASGYCSHAEGHSTTASSYESHAEGFRTIASGGTSHTEGESTTASGLRAHAEGGVTVASGSNSHAQNFGTIAAKNCQTAIGKYNIEDTETTKNLQKLFIIGNGEADNYRSNALTVDWSGNVDIAAGASYKINGVALNASDVGAQAPLTPANGISITNNVIGHSNSVTAQTTQALYPIKIDSEGHISGYGAAITSLPASDVSAWAKAATKPTYTAAEVGALPLTGGTITGQLTYVGSHFDATQTNNGVSAIQYPTTVNLLDVGYRVVARLEGIIEPSGNVGSHWYVRNYNTSGAQVAQKGITMTMAKDGALTYIVSDPDKFRSAIDAAPNYTYSTTDLTAGTSALDTGEIYLVYV